MVTIYSATYMKTYHLQLTVFRWINAPGVEAENEPLPLSELKLPVGTQEYINIKCWKYDSDRFSSFWDMSR